MIADQNIQLAEGTHNESEDIMNHVEQNDEKTIKQNQGLVWVSVSLQWMCEWCRCNVRSCPCRCFFIAQSYVVVKKWSEALVLYERVLKHAGEVQSKAKSLNNSLKVHYPVTNTYARFPIQWKQMHEHTLKYPWVHYKSSHLISVLYFDINKPEARTPTILLHVFFPGVFSRISVWKACKHSTTSIDV